MNNNDAAVRIENLTRRFGDFLAVDNISLTVGRGEIFGFLGANGAGKTTAIRMMTGLLLPSDGHGWVAGLDINTQSELIKHRIGYMSQKFSLYPDLTGRENLTFYGSAYDMEKKRVKRRTEELTEQLSLGEFIDRKTASIPTGWRQRLALSAALLHEPEIIFLDEPTGGVDPVYRRKFWNILYELADHGITVFVTTHYMDEAEFCGRISIMHQGRIIVLGKPHELVESHKAANLEEMFVDLIQEREGLRA